MRRILLFGLCLALCFVTACRTSNRKLPHPNVDSSNTLTKDLSRHLSARARLDTFRTALQRTGLLQRLDHAGPYTVFAPTNKAFAQAPPSFDTLYFSGSADSLRLLLNYHLAYGAYDHGHVGSSLRISTLSEDRLLLKRDTTVPGGVRVQGHAPLERVRTRNGILYVLPKLLNPASDTTDAKSG